MERNEEMISEERARAIWHRAAQLQAETVQRIEDRSRSLAVRNGADPAAEGFRRSEVEAAAVEAGISAEFVQLAFVETGETGTSSARLDGWQDRAATRLLGTRERHIELTRTIAASAPEVLAAMQRIFPTHPFFLTLTDSVGEPLRGGTLLFKLPDFAMGTGVTTPFAQNAATVGLKQIRVRLRPLAEGGAGPCEVILGADLHQGVRQNWWWGTALSGTAGGLGAAVGLTAGAKALALAGALVALPAVAAGVAIGGAGALGFGALYRYYFRKLVEDFRQLLQILDVNARTGGAFSPPPPPRRDDGSTAAIISSF